MCVGDVDLFGDGEVEVVVVFGVFDGGLVGVVFLFFVCVSLFDVLDVVDGFVVGVVDGFYVGVEVLVGCLVCFGIVGV